MGRVGSLGLILSLLGAQQGGANPSDVLPAVFFIRGKRTLRHNNYYYSFLHIFINVSAWKKRNESFGRLSVSIRQIRIFSEPKPSFYMILGLQAELILKVDLCVNKSLAFSDTALLDVG